MYQTLKEVRNKIQTELDTLKWSWKPLVNVYPYHILNDNWFPYISFEPLNLEQEISDTANNNRNYWFEVIIHQEFNTKTRWQALDILVDIFDEIINTFDKNITLNNNVIKISPVNANFQPLVSDKGKVYICILQLNVEILLNTKL